MTGKGRRPSTTRVVTYAFDRAAGFDDGAVERLLARAQAAGIVTRYDSGRGHACWLQGPPGPHLRGIRDQVRAIVERGRPR